MEVLRQTIPYRQNPPRAWDFSSVANDENNHAAWNSLVLSTYHEIEQTYPDVLFSRTGTGYDATDYPIATDCIHILLTQGFVDAMAADAGRREGFALLGELVTQYRLLQMRAEQLNVEGYTISACIDEDGTVQPNIRFEQRDCCSVSTHTSAKHRVIEVQLPDGTMTMILRCKMRYQPSRDYARITRINTPEELFNSIEQMRMEREQVSDNHAMTQKRRQDALCGLDAVIAAAYAKVCHLEKEQRMQSQIQCAMKQRDYNRLNTLRYLLSQKQRGRVFREYGQALQAASVKDASYQTDLAGM